MAGRKNFCFDFVPKKLCVHDKLKIHCLEKIQKDFYFFEVIEKESKNFSLTKNRKLSSVTEKQVETANPITARLRREENLPTPQETAFADAWLS
jgi:hypothetical protein